MQLCIIADDLTGAADSAARCHSEGLTATIFLSPPHALPSVGALAFTTDSRALTTDAAAQRVYALTAQIASQTDDATCHWYKKLDSTLRGHLGSELDAMLDCLEAERERYCAIVCPAFPAQHRGLFNGHLVMKPAPSTETNLPRLLRVQSRHSVDAFFLPDVRAGAEHLAAQLRNACQRGTRLFTVDALQDDDLHTIVRAAQKALPRVLLCGSAGLVGAFATYLIQQGARTSEKDGVLDTAIRSLRNRGPCLIVVGSGSQTAHRQIETLRAQEEVQVVQVGAQNVRLRNADTLLHLPKPGPGATLEGEEARTHLARLGDASMAAVESLRPSLLVLVGGDTAIEMMQRMGVAHLHVLTELLPGMPLAQGKSTAGDDLLIILKAGSHGEEGVFVDLRERARAFMRVFMQAPTREEEKLDD